MGRVSSVEDMRSQKTRMAKAFLFCFFIYLFMRVQEASVVFLLLHCMYVYHISCIMHNRDESAMPKKKKNNDNDSNSNNRPL